MWEAYVQLVTVCWQKGMSSKPSPGFASLRSINTLFKAAHLNRFVSLTASCCDILVSQLIYNFVCECVVAVIVLCLFVYLFFVASVCSFFCRCVMVLPVAALWGLFFAWLADLFGRSMVYAANVGRFQLSVYSCYLDDCHTFIAYHSV